MDLILHNGVIHTMKGREVVSALAIKDGLVAGSGSDAEMLALKTARTTVVDLQKQLAVPGFNDSHLHILNYGLSKSRLDLSGSRSVAEIISKGKDYLAHRTGISMLLGRGWNQDHFADHSFPTRGDLDKISVSLPIVLHRVCGHSAVVNTRALEFFGIDGNTKAPDGGSIDVDGGLFCEAALDLIQPPALSKKEIENILAEATADMLKKGITSAQSDDFGLAAYTDVVSAYAGLALNGKLPVRVYQQCLFDNLADIKGFLANANTYTQDNAFYRLGPIKLLTDGSLGARTAFLSRPYHDDSSTSGIPCFSQGELDDMVAYCHQQGRATAIHCIGDGALQMALRSVEMARQAYGAGPRHGIVHCQISDMPLLQKLRELDLAAYIQPIFLDYDIHIAEARVGAELASTSYNFRTLYDLGVPVALGTDCPVEPFDPLANIYCAVTRKDLSGFPANGFCPEQALSVHEAVYCYTVGSAWCSYEENIKGRLEPGFWADIAVLDKDIFTIDPPEIKNARVKMTIVGGKIVYAE